MNVFIQQHNVKEENILYPMCGGSIPHLNKILGFGGCGGVCSAPLELLPSKLSGKLASSQLAQRLN